MRFNVLSSPYYLMISGIGKNLFLKGHQRRVIGSWRILVLMVLWSYTGNLLSLLAVRYIPQPIQTIRQLLDSGYTVIMEPNTVVTATLAVS